MHNRPLVLISFLEDKKTSVIVLLIIGFLIYFNSLFGEFVWDDKSQIVYNPIVHSVGNIPQFFLGSTFIDLLSGGRQSGMHYRPIMSSIFAVLYSIFGPKPFFFHLIPVTLHVVNSILILFLMRNFLTKNLAFILALIFLVHPMNVEVVSYISALHDVLFLTFGLSAFLVLLRSEKDKPPFKLIMVFLLLSLFSKITGVLFFLILGIYLFLFKKTYLRQFIFLSLLTIGIFFLFRVVLAGVVAARIPDIPIMRISFLERMRNVPAMAWFYIKTFFFPKDLIVAQYWLVQRKTISNFYLPLILITISFLLLLGCNTYLFLKKSKRFPVFLLFSVWLIAGLGFHMQIVPLDFTVSERWFYFPMVGMLGIIGVILQDLISENAQMKTVVLILFFTFTSILSYRTILRNFDWRSDFVLFSHDRELSEPNYLMEGFLGLEYQARGEYEKALAHDKRAFELNPWGVTMLYNLGNLYEKMNDYESALKYYKRFNDITDAEFGYNSYAELLITCKEDYKSAKEILDRAIQKYPNSADLWFLSAIAEYKLGNETDALIAAQRAINTSSTSQSQNIYSLIFNGKPVDIKPVCQ